MSTLEFSDEVFIIDDDPAHKDRLSSLFRAERYRVINFEAREALTGCQAARPCVSPHMHPHARPR
jgi:FixJ family two-component response regulator